MAGTTVRYNDVWIKDCETLLFNQEVMYDDSNTDTVFSKFTIRVLGSVHPDQLANHAVQFGTNELPGPASDLVQLLQARLSHPRGHFQYSVDGKVLLEAVPVPGQSHSDVNNGPKPLRVDIVRVVGSRLYRVEFEIEICTVKCAEGYETNIPNWPPQNAEQNHDVLNNRWTCHEERDGNFYNTRVTEGILRISHASFVAHMYRWLVVPMLPRGYRRESQRFWDSADGLSLRYQIVDRQKYCAPPSPAVDWYAVYTESSGEGGAVGFGEMRVILDGAANCDKQHLLYAAVNVVLSRLRGLVSKPDDKSYSQLLHLAIVEHLHAARVEVTAHCKHTNSDAEYLNARIANIRRGLVDQENTSDEQQGAFADYDPDLWPVPSPYAHSENAAAWAHYWQDPCVDIHGIPDPLTMEVENPHEPEDKRDETDYGHAEINPDVPPPYPPSVERQVSPTQDFCPYTYFRADYELEMDYCTVPMPAASFQGGSSVGAKTMEVFCTWLSAGVQTLVVKIHAERIGEWPLMPEPTRGITDDQGVVYQSLGYKLFPSTPTLCADGRSKLYTLQGHYRFFLSRSLTYQDHLYLLQDPRLLPAPLDKLLDFRTIFYGVQHP